MNTVLEKFYPMKAIFKKSFDLLNCSFYHGKRIMAFSVELSITPTVEISHKILNNVDENLDVYFAKKKTLDETGLWSSYTLDKRISESH